MSGLRKSTAMIAKYIKIKDVLKIHSLEYTIILDVSRFGLELIRIWLITGLS